MKQRKVLGLLLAAALGCSNLTGDSKTPIVIDVFPVAGSGISGQVEIGDTAVLTAVALNQQGDSVAASFTWSTADTGFIFLDPQTGQVSGKQPGTARVQARSGSLISDLVTLTVVPMADSLVLIPPAGVQVPATDTASSPLVAELDSIDPAGPTLGPLAGRQIVYTLVPISGDTGQATLNGGVDTLATTTGGTGSPTISVHVRKVPGRGHPDSVYVEIRSYRPSSTTQNSVQIPGSGQMFVVRFDP